MVNQGFYQKLCLNVFTETKPPLNLEQFDSLWSLLTIDQL